MTNSKQDTGQCRYCGRSQNQFNEPVSGRFQRYLELSRIAVAACRNNLTPESEWDSAIQLCDEAAESIARQRSRNLTEVFEKLFIWRVECLERAPSDFIYFNDLFPLSAYFDVKSMLGDPAICPRADAALFDNLLTLKSDGA